jgi:hypothetical protein
VSGRIRSIEKSKDINRTRTCDLLVCSIVPQQTMLLCAPTKKYTKQTKAKLYLNLKLVVTFVNILSVWFSSSEESEYNHILQAWLTRPQ